MDLTDIRLQTVTNLEIVDIYAYVISWGEFRFHSSDKSLDTIINTNTKLYKSYYPYISHTIIHYSEK